MRETTFATRVGSVVIAFAVKRFSWYNAAINSPQFLRPASHSQTLRRIDTEATVQHTEFELGVGESIQIGNQILTVIDIDGPEISVRIDDADFSTEALPLALAAESLGAQHG